MRTAPTRVRVARQVPGCAVAVAIATVATVAGRLVPVVGAPVVAVLLGLALSGSVRRVPRVAPGVAFAGTRLLQVTVVVLGTQVSLRDVVRVGAASLPVMLGTLVACLAAAWLVGRLLGIDSEVATLVGVGTAICGASAIAAVSPVLRARSHAVAYAVSTIVVFNVAAVLAFPPLGHTLHLTQQQFGLFAGTAVNDTSSVVAAATTFGVVAGHHAVVVKLVRTLMIVPVGLALGWVVRRRDARGSGAGSVGGRAPVVPWFVVGFVVASAVATLAAVVGTVPTTVRDALPLVSGFLVTTALAAVGLSTDVAALRRVGPRPLVLGGILWVVVTTTSLALQGVL